MLALTLVLAAGALLSLKPWETDSLVPKLSVAPGLGAALGDAVEVAPAQPLHVADARVADAKRVTAVVKPDATTPKQPGSGVELGISQGHPVGGPGPAPIPASPVEPPPAPEPVAAPPAPAPAPAPVATPAPTLVAGAGGGGQPPTTAAVGETDSEDSEPAVEICEGEEIAIFVSLDREEMPDEETEVEITIRRFESDGTESEIHLQGKLSDVRSLIDQLVAEGSCELTGGDLAGAEGDEVPEAPVGDLGATSSEATLEPDLP